MARGVERTAVGAGVLRAIEGDDHLARRMLTGWSAALVRNRALRWAFLHLMERAGPGFRGAVVCRTWAIDDACREALASGCRQVVVIGAGLDTRPYRMPEMRAAAQVLELDLPGVQQEKKEALTRALGRLPGHVRYVPLDLTRQSLADAGADATVLTLVLCEAVSMYLPADAVEQIIAYAGGFPAGSRLVITYLPRAVAEDPRFARWRRVLNWRTAYHPAEIAGRLAGHGLTVLADLGAEEHRKRLDGRELAVFDGERIAVAERAHPA